MLRKFVTSLLAGLAVIVVLSFAPAPAAAQQYSPNYGGNCDRGYYGPPSHCDGYGPRVRRGRVASRGDRTGAMHGQRFRGYEYHRHSEQQSHRTEWQPVHKVGSGVSIPPTDSRCWTLPNGNRRCPNL